MATNNFKLTSEFQTLGRRSFPLADPTILNPTNAQPLVDGEWLQLNTSYQMARGTVNPAIVPSFAYFAEQGRYETQALGKGPFLYLNSYEADTLIMDATGLVVGDALEVADVTIGGIVRRALQEYTSGLIVGYVTRLPANNNNYLRFFKTLG
jgi:hypothetical protein